MHPNGPAVVEAVLATPRGTALDPVESININSTLRAPSADPSAHPTGHGVDINRINGKAVRCAHIDFRGHAHCKKLSDDQIRDMQEWVTALQDAFWADCRVNQVMRRPRRQGS